LQKRYTSSGGTRREGKFHFNSAGYQKGRNRRSNRRFISVLCGPRLPGCYVLAHVFFVVMPVMSVCRKWVTVVRRAKRKRREKGGRGGMGCAGIGKKGRGQDGLDFVVEGGVRTGSRSLLASSWEARPGKDGGRARRGCQGTGHPVPSPTGRGTYFWAPDASFLEIGARLRVPTANWQKDAEGDSLGQGSESAVSGVVVRRV
jgi:hypothetical protein